MSLKNTKSELWREFQKVKKDKNPKKTADLEAVVVLSGESGDPSYKTNLKDTQERTEFGIKITKKIENVGGSPTLVLNGTDWQNRLMAKIAKKAKVKKIEFIKNPPVPKASTLTQIQGLSGLPFRKIAIVTHAYHGPRTKRYLKKNLPEVEFELFLLDREKIEKGKMEEEIEKISKYSKKGDI